MEHCAAVVIGAGVVGLACARALARRGIETIILERHTTFGSETSSRNSEVIHAGLYYPDDSRKAALCVAGRTALYDYCAARHIAHRRCGKLVVATAAGQLPKLEALARQGQANDVADLGLIDADEARRLEPALACVAALHSPSTGIIDSHGLMRALLADAERDGAVLALKSPLAAARVTADGIVLAVGDAPDPTLLRARFVINAAGLSATQVAARIDGLPREHCPTPRYAKGNYYALAGRAPFSRLIYPLPEPGGLGVHLTLDLGGQARFGPDVEWLPDDWIAAPEYGVDPARCAGFYAEVRRYWPQLPDGALSPAYCGVRPKIGGAGNGEPAADFLIDGPETHGVRGLVNLFGIESPGLTACLAIADAACAALDLPAA